jgi:2-methylcitrate dehydratase PrpD
MATARNPNLVGMLHGLLWGMAAAVVLRELGAAAIFIAIALAVVMGVTMRAAYAHGNRYRD